MKKKIFVAIFAGILGVLSLAIISLIFIIERFEIRQSFERLNLALNEIPAEKILLNADKNLSLKNEPKNHKFTLNFLTPFRLTIINLNGEVKFDSHGETSENHLNRAEIQKALKEPEKTAFSKRISATLNENLLYAARLVQIKGEKFIVRLSEKKPSFVAILRNFTPFLIAFFVITLFLSLIIARILSRKIIAPIDKIDLSHPIKTNPYKELEIFMRRIAKQKKKIKKQVKLLKIRQSENEMLVRHISEGFLLANAEFKVIYANDFALNLLGISQNDSLFENEILAKFKENLSISQENAKNTSFECEINGKNFEIITLFVWIKAKFKALIMIMVDKSAQVAAANLRREFSANVSHELKTPLSVILASSEMLKNGLVREADKAEFIGKIYDESKRLLNLIDKILLLSFLDENSPNSLKSTLDLNEIIKRVQKNLSTFASERGVKIITQNPAKPCKIVGVSSLIEDMIYNLAQNAIKYSFEGGAVWIDAQNLGSGVVRLCVKDEGIGIPKDEQERVFERFYCVDRSRFKSSEFSGRFKDGVSGEFKGLGGSGVFGKFEDLGGSGLGLSIVKHIARIHNAKINLQSELGKGTSVEVEFGV